MNGAQPVAFWKKSEALQHEKIVFGGNNEIAVWLCVINVRDSNAIQGRC